MPARKHVKPGETIHSSLCLVRFSKSMSSQGVNQNTFGRMVVVAGSAALVSLLSVLAGCGGSSSTPAATVSTLAAGPATFSAFGNTINTVTITGGTGPYTVRSSDSATISVPTTVTGASLTITPRNVLANSVVTLTVTDKVGATSAVTVTVVPATITTPVIAVTSASGSTCAAENNAAVSAATLCAGETGSASVMVKDANGAVLANREVRFEVLSFGGTVAPKPDSTVFARLATVTTDATGKATVALKADVEAGSEAAFLRATDVVSTHRIDTWFTVLKQTNGASALNVVPATGGFTSFYLNECPLVRREYGINGGKAPYAVTLPAANTLVLNDGTANAVPGAGITVARAGARFNVLSTDATTCTSAATSLTVTDALGATTTASFVLTAGAATRPAATTDLTLSPPNLSMAADLVSTYCSTSSARYIVTGGAAPYVVSTSIPQIVATINSAGIVDVSFVSDSKWKMLKAQVARILVLDAAGKVVTATLGCN